jgi:signal transduction histidine kinase
MDLHLAIADHLGLAVEKAYRMDQLAAARNAYLEILGFVSHELRGPLTAMLLTADTLTRGLLGDLKPEQRSQVQRIGTNARYMATMIQQYLDLARLDADHAQFWPERGVDFAKMVLEPAIDMVRPQLEVKRMRITVRSPDLWPTIECDSELLKVVLVNLLGNAVKYGYPEGRIEVRWGRTGEGFECAVRNEGPGFPIGQQPRLFRKFSRLRAPELLRQRGSGLGLYNVWRVVRMHGGRVSAQSGPGRWAEFAFFIPQPLPVALQLPQRNAGDVDVQTIAARASRELDLVQELLEEAAWPGHVDGADAMPGHQTVEDASRTGRTKRRACPTERPGVAY